jgi:exonuclease SbcC
MTESLFLKRLKLQQFRSFADLDIELDDGPGVLIVQGPNGLGKSSLFHGLEWLLTDQVEHFRLIDPDKPPASYLCRWAKPLQEATSVSMEFSDGKTLSRALAGPAARTSKLTGVPNLAGYLRANDWKAEIEDVSHYLLLTHFLSQSNVPRLSHRDGKLRFDILKEAAQSKEPERMARALHGLGTTRPAKAYTAAKARLDEDAASLTALLEQEASAWSDAQTAGAINDSDAEVLGREIATLVRTAVDADADAPVLADVSVTVLATALDAANETVNQRALAVIQARELVDRRASLDISMETTDEALRICNARLTELPTEETAARAQLGHAITTVESTGLKLSAAQIRSAKVTELETTEATLAALNQADADSPEPDAYVKRRAAAENEIASLGRRRQIMDRLASEMVTLREEIERSEERRALVEQIIESEARLAGGKAELTTLELETPQVDLLVAAAEQHAQATGEIVDAIEASVSGMIAATDAITGAVMTIVVNLPETACDCPVCATKFGTPEAFRSRALAVSDRLTPEISRQQAHLVEARSRHEAALAESNRLRPLAAKIDDLHKRVEADRAAFTALLQRAGILNLDVLSDFAIQGSELEAKIEDYRRGLARRRRWSAFLTLEQDGSDRLQAAVRARDAASRELDLHERGRDERATRKAWLRSEIERLQHELFGHRPYSAADLDAMSADAIEAANTARAEQEKAQADASLANQTLNRLQEEIAAQSARSTALADEIARLTQDQESLARQWAALKLDRRSDETAIAQIARIEGEIGASRGRLSEAASRLQRLRDGRVVWSRQRAHTDALERLRARIKAASNHTRDQVRDAATAKVQTWARRSGVVARTKNLAASASAEIEIELNSFNSDYIRPLEKLMGRINRSILCDPTIGIEFTVQKNSVDQSAVKGNEIPKDRGGIDPRLVHSEGQMAALGVSLMSAASLTFPWSRWKAMVLDDPLQHNDAIHAAAFADFIGNLVLSREYQIFLSTHELGQAEFLRRKFKARGIPCSMVSLIGAGDEGVETNIERAVPFGTGLDSSPDMPAEAG